MLNLVNINVNIDPFDHKALNMDENEIAVKRREQNFNMIKFFFGTVLLGVMAHLINREIQTKQIELQVSIAETNYVSNFTSKFFEIPVEQMDDRIGYLKFLSVLSQSDSVRARYIKLHDHFKTTYQAIESKKDTLEKLGNTVSNEIAKVEAAETELATKVSLENGKPLTDEQIQKNRKVLQDFEENENVIKAKKVRGDIETKKAEVSVGFANTMASVDTVIRKWKWIEDGWVKEGYYRPHGPDSIYIAVTHLDSDEGKVIFELRTQVKRATGSQTVFELGLPLSERSEFVNLNGKQYFITLNKIDRAGRNPFNQAAYYTIKQVQ